jgi:hypothetical protein
MWNALPKDVQSLYYRVKQVVVPNSNPNQGRGRSMNGGSAPVGGNGGNPGVVVSAFRWNAHLVRKCVDLAVTADKIKRRYVCHTQTTLHHPYDTISAFIYVLVK